MHINVQIRVDLSMITHLNPGNLSFVGYMSDLERQGRI